jgi:hypothetical protein
MGKGTDENRKVICSFQQSAVGSRGVRREDNGWRKERIKNGWGKQRMEIEKKSVPFNNPLLNLGS